MKNKIFLSLALLVASNTFIATAAMAYDWSEAKRHALATGKTALGVTALGIGAWAQLKIVSGSGDWIGSFVKRQGFEPVRFSGIKLLPTPAIYALAGAIGVAGGVICYKALKSAWNDFNTQEKKSEITNSRLPHVTNPLITHFAWGKVKVDFAGASHTFKDCKLSPKLSQKWDWNEFGTKHDPGIQIKDLNSIIDDCDIIILSRGVDRVLQIPQETVDYIKNQGKQVDTLQSEEAVKRYNDLVNQKKRVGLLLHSTC